MNRDIREQKTLNVQHRTPNDEGRDQPPTPRLRRAKDDRDQGVNPMRGFGGGDGKAGGSIISITRCKIVTITAS
jgi:hypothetical protein